VSDPTAPPSEPHRDDDVPAEDTPPLDSEPIDVNELLESTRKLFEPEELQRSMEQAGYTPEPPASNAGEPDGDTEGPGGAADEEAADQVVGEPKTPAGDQDSDAEPAGDANETAPEPDAPVDVTTDGADQLAPDELAEDEIGQQEPPLKGFNILSIAAFVLALALSPLAVIFGYIALGQTRRARQRGETLALWAIGLGWLVFAAWVVLIASLIWIGYQQGITVESFREFIELFSLP
jgi:hypothetical protein